jgi:hypothetical protein
MLIPDQPGACPLGDLELRPAVLLLPILQFLPESVMLAGLLWPGLTKENMGKLLASGKPLVTQA